MSSFGSDIIYNDNSSKEIDKKKSDFIQTFSSRLGKWPITIGDTYGVYTVIEIKPDFNHPTNVNYATITLLCSECGSIIFKNYNTLKKQLRKGKLDVCKCFSIPKDDKLKDDPLFKKISRNLYEARQRFKKEYGFRSDPPRKIFLAFTDKEKEDIDLSSDVYEYWITTKDGTLNYVAGNITFRKVLKTSVVVHALSDIYVDPLYVDKRRRIRCFLKEKISKNNCVSLEDFGGCTFLKYKKSKYSHRIKIGSVLGTLKIIDYLKCDERHYNRCVCECQKCGFRFARLPKRFLFEKNYTCPHCCAGYKQDSHKKNTATLFNKEKEKKLRREIAAMECTSDFTRYSSLGMDVIDLKLDSDRDSFCIEDYLDVFGYSY